MLKLIISVALLIMLPVLSSADSNNIYKEMDEIDLIILKAEIMNKMFDARLACNKEEFETLAEILELIDDTKSLTWTKCENN